jgi:hypothetical protein
MFINAMHQAASLMPSNNYCWPLKLDDEHIDVRFLPKAALDKDKLLKNLTGHWT